MKNSKIENFVEGLIDHTLPEEQQSLVLACEDSLVAGDNVGGNCSNYEETACSGTNTKCTNHGVCGTSTNKKTCSNRPITIGKITIV